MIVCGVDITAKTAILALVSGSAEENIHVQCATKKLLLDDDRDTQSLLNIKASIEAFASQNKVDLFVIKGRQATGPRASSGVTFKIETLFQLSQTPVAFVSPPTLASFVKGNGGGVPTTVFNYQKDAFRAGAWYLSNI